MNTSGALALNPSFDLTQGTVPAEATLESLLEPEVRPSRRRFVISGIVAVLILSGAVVFRSHVFDSRFHARGTPATATQPESESPGSTTVTAKPSAKSSVATPAGSDTKPARIQPAEANPPETAAGHRSQADMRSKTDSENTSKENGRVRELINQAQSQMDQGSYDDAISTYAAALQLDSHNSAARNGKRRAEKAKQYEQQLEETQ
jgi:hypothetical protein